MTKHPDDHRKLWLAKLANDNNFTTAVEIGVQEGITFSHLVETCPQLYVIGIDPWGRGTLDDNYYNNLSKKYGEHPRAQLIRSSSFSAHKFFADETQDMIFIDGDHTYNGVSRDIANWTPKVKKGGYVCGHDINQPQIRKAVKEYFGNYQTGPDLIWYVKK